MAKASSIDVSDELVKIAKFEESLRNVEKILQPALSKPLSEIHDELQPIDRAKFDLTMAFALNSLFWMYLKTIGEDPEEHKVNFGLQRIRNYMKNVEEIIAKEHAPRLDAGAAKRFVRSSLWTPKNDSTESARDSKKEMQPEKKSNKTHQDIQNKKVKKTTFKKNIKHRNK